MKRLCLSVIFLFFNAGALAQEATSVPVVKADELAFKPPITELLYALSDSSVDHASTNVLLAHDKSGKVIGVKLEHSTGSKLLDAAILGWAAKIRLKGQEAGISSLSVSFERQ